MTTPASLYPSPAQQRWVERAVGAGARVVGGRRLRGGMTAMVHRLSVERANGARLQVVLKRYLNPKWRAWQREMVNAEVETLTAIEASVIPAPTSIAADPWGMETDGVPCSLISRVPGSVWLRPEDMESWLRQQAELLPHVHALPPPPQGREQLRLSTPTVPESATRPDVWQSAIKLVECLVPGEEVRVHGDYQHFNVLWSRGRLTGLVDWGWSPMASPDVDVGHCRLNLALLFGAEVAERFRLLYEAEAGRTVDPLQDLEMLLEYGDGWRDFIPTQVAGRAPVDTARMTARIEDLITLTLARC